MTDIQNSLELVSKNIDIIPQELLNHIDKCIHSQNETLNSIYIPRKYEILFQAISVPLSTQASSRKDSRYWDRILNIFKATHDYYQSVPHIQRHWFQRTLYEFSLLRLISELFGELLENKQTKYDHFHEYNIEKLFCSISKLLKFLRTSPFDSFYTLSNQGSSYTKFIIFTSRLFTRQLNHLSWAQNSNDPCTHHLYDIIFHIDHFLVEYLHTRCNSAGFSRFFDTPDVLSSIIVIIEHSLFIVPFSEIISQAINTQESLLRNTTESISLPDGTSWNSILEWIQMTEFPTIPTLIIQIIKIIMIQKSLSLMKSLFPIFISSEIARETKCWILFIFLKLSDTEEPSEHVIQAILECTNKEKVYYNGCKISNTLIQRIRSLLSNIINRYSCNSIILSIYEIDSSIFTVKHILKLNNLDENILKRLITSRIANDLASTENNDDLHPNIWKVLVRNEFQIDIHSILLSKLDNSIFYLEMLIELYIKHPDLCIMDSLFVDAVNISLKSSFNINLMNLSMIPAYIKYEQNRSLLLNYIRDNVEILTISRNPFIMHCLCKLFPDSRYIIESCISNLNCESKMILLMHCNLFDNLSERNVLIRMVLEFILEKRFLDITGFLSIQSSNFREYFNDAIIDIISDHSLTTKSIVDILCNVPFEYIQDRVWRCLFEELICTSNQYQSNIQLLNHLCDVSLGDHYQLLNQCVSESIFLISEWLIIVLENQSLSFDQVNNISKTLKKLNININEWVMNILGTISNWKYSGLICVILNLWIKGHPFPYDILNEIIIQGLEYINTDYFEQNVVFQSYFLKACIIYCSSKNTIIANAIFDSFQKIYKDNNDSISIPWMTFLCNCAPVIYKDSILNSVQRIILDRMILLELDINNNDIKQLMNSWLRMNQMHYTIQFITSNIRDNVDSKMIFLLSLLVNALYHTNDDNIQTCISSIIRILIKMNSCTNDIMIMPQIKLLYTWMVSRKVESAPLMFEILNYISKCSPMDSGPILLDMQKQYFRQILKIPGLWTFYIHTLISLNWTKDSIDIFKRLCIQMIKNAKMTPSWRSIIRKHIVYIIGWCIWKLLSQNAITYRNTLEYCVKSLGNLCKRHESDSELNWISLQLHDSNAKSLLDHLMEIVKQKNENLDRKRRIVFGKKRKINSIINSR